MSVSSSSWGLGRAAVCDCGTPWSFLLPLLQQSERDATRFLWVKDCGRIRFDNSNIQEYRFCRIPFGVISSPFLLGATVETHLELYGSEVAMKLKDDIYVDNVITGTNSIEDAVHLYREAKLIFRKASMNFRELVSNHSQVNQIIEKEDMAICESTKVLGHTWTIESDTISLKRSNSQLEQTQLTKRNLLKEIASVFGPLGLLSPVLSAFRTFVRFVLVWICRFPLPLSVWEGLRFVIVALPGLFSCLFYC